jgi:hypothetical protein
VKTIADGFRVSHRLKKSAVFYKSSRIEPVIQQKVDFRALKAVLSVMRKFVFARHSVDKKSGKSD